MFERILNKLGYTKIPKSPNIQHINIDSKYPISQIKGRWSPEAKQKAKQRRAAKKWRQDNRLLIMKKSHKNRDIKVHLDDCPACNPSSTTTIDEYISKVRVIVRQHAVAQKQKDKHHTLVIDHTKDDDALIIEGTPAKDFPIHERPLPNLCTNKDCIHYNTWHPNQPCENAKGGFII